jgi:hypothetical protein
MILAMSDLTATTATRPIDRPTVRAGEAAEMLGVTVETLRRWEVEGRLRGAIERPPAPRPARGSASRPSADGST